MSKELTPEMREQIDILETCLIEAPVDFIGTSTSHSASDKMEREWKKSWEGAIEKLKDIDFKSISEIQELRENLRLALENAKDMTIRRDHWMQVNGSNERLIDKLNEHKAERDHRIIAMSEYIKALEEVKDSRMVNPHYGNGSVKKKLEALRDKAGL